MISTKRQSEFAACGYYKYIGKDAELKNIIFIPILSLDWVCMLDVSTEAASRYIPIDDNNFNDFVLLFTVDDVWIKDVPYIEEFGEEGVDWWRIPVSHQGNTVLTTFIRRSSHRDISKATSRYSDMLTKELAKSAPSSDRINKYINILNKLKHQDIDFCELDFI